MTIRQDIRILVEQTFRSGGWGQRDIAKAIGYSVSTVSSYLAGKYKGNVNRLEAALITWLRKQGVAVTDDDIGLEFIATRASRAVMGACRQSQEEGVIRVCIGRPGLGKTMGLEAYARHARAEGIRFLLFTANVTTTDHALIRQLAVELNVAGAGRGTSSERMEGIKGKLSREPEVIVIDEAQWLNLRALEAVRHIHDTTLTGVVLVGSLVLERTLVEWNERIELAQLQDRVDTIERLQVMRPIEVGAFVEKWLGGQRLEGPCLSLLADKSAGVPRRLVRILTHCRRIADSTHVPISVAVVNAAVEKLVGNTEPSDSDSEPGAIAAN